MRTTIDLPDDLHRVALSIAQDQGQSLSATVARLIRRGIRDPAPAAAITQRNGLPVLSLGHPVTTEDVRELDDEE